MFWIIGQYSLSTKYYQNFLFVDWATCSLCSCYTRYFYRFTTNWLDWLFLISPLPAKVMWLAGFFFPFEEASITFSHKQATLASFIIMLQSKETILRYRGLYFITKINSLAQINVSVNPFLSHVPSRELGCTSVGLTKPCYTELTMSTVKLKTYYM